MPRPPNASRVKALQSTACSVAPAALVEEEVAQPTAPADLPASRSPLRVMNVDTHAASPKAIAELKAAGMLAESVKLGQVTYLNNLIEQDHRFIKRLVKPGMGFFSFETAWRTLRGYEVMHMIRKGQMQGVNKGTGAYLRRNLLVAALRMLIRLYNDPRTHDLSLRRCVSADELVELFDFFCRQFYWISGPGTSLWHHLPDPV